MFTLHKLLVGAVFAAGLVVVGSVGAGDTKKQTTERPSVEVVFCVDTTGSMDGLIDAAKQKIWSICSQVAAGNPTPRVRVGLVAYRDRGDAYVTKVFPLTEDLDAVHTELMSYKAEGGGDFPESVNEALYQAVHAIKWTENKNTFRLIFLVGDAPPHMDYPDDVKYPETCQVACKKEIIINTIQCGSHNETERFWRHISRLAEGDYVQIDARGGAVVMTETPFDDELVKINSELANTTLAFGDAKRQEAAQKQTKANLELPKAVAADRAGYYGNTGGGAAYDLLENIKNKAVKLEDLKKDHLPPVMRNMTLPEQKAFLDKLDKTRTELNSKAKALDRKRADYIANKLAEEDREAVTQTFDGQVLRLLQRQATRANIEYAPANAKKK